MDTNKASKPPKRKKRKTFDWEAIERKFRAGRLSIREIAREHGCTDGAIHNRARRHGWERDLSGAVRERIQTKLVRANVSTSDAKKDEEIIEEAADMGAQVLTLHRKDIANLRRLEQKLIDKIDNDPTKLYLAQYQGSIIQKEVALTASELSAAAANLAQVQHKRIALERQAFNLDDDSLKEEAPAVVIYERK